MYITYETRQWREEGDPHKRSARRRYTGPHALPPQRFSHPLPNPAAFVPTWLVRTSDMKKVPGSSVNEGYCALSYSWSQSGEIIFDKNACKAKRVDQGNHRIIFPAKVVRKKPRGRKRIRRKVKFVKFEDVIQQVCKDFNIKYIWYDQMCINQDDPQEKHREIHHMHEIYSNAYCTVVSIPEFRTYFHLLPNERPTLAAWRRYKSIEQSKWMQRLWTLEEALLSRRLLFVGRDVHTWWNTHPRALRELCKPPQSVRWNVCDILKHAHERKSSNEHDRIYALANLFPEIIKKIKVDYAQPLPELMTRFYGLLAEMDASILCFEKAYLNGNILRKYDLPSWTGVAGKHIAEYSHSPDGVFQGATLKDYSIEGRCMRVTCTSISNIKDAINEDPRTWRLDDLPPVPEGPTEKFGYWKLAISVQLPGHRASKTVVLPSSIPTNTRMGRPINSQWQYPYLSLFIPFKKENLSWCYKSPRSNEPPTSIYFSLTDKSAYPDQDYNLLTGIHFTRHDAHRFPVIRKEGDHYKAIGTCFIDNPEYFFSDYTAPPEQTFIIE